MITAQYSAALLASPQRVQIQAAITAAITAYQSILSSVGTATIMFNVMNTGLGGSSTYLLSTSYQGYRQKLVTYASSSSDLISLGSVPNQVNDPVRNGANVWLKTALARTLGYAVGNGLDSTVSVNVGICNMNRVTVDPLK